MTKTVPLTLVVIFVVFAGIIFWFERRPPVKWTRKEFKGYSDNRFIALLQKYVGDDGKVDYHAWKNNRDDVAALEDFSTQLANVSPDNHPEWFPDSTTRRAYWIQAYNALVVRGVLNRWPLKNLRKVKRSATSFLIPGKGFFYDSPIVLGGRTTNLYDLENKILRKRLQDARIHFALNCASGSCPPLRARTWSEEDLDTASRDFVNDSKNVRVENNAVWLSRIFEWYREDFTGENNSPEALIDYLLGYAVEPLEASLQTARRKKWPLKFVAYDWEINARAVQPNQP